MVHLKSIIIGLGEVGSALQEILTKAYSYKDVSGVTRDGSFGNLKQKFDIMHICIGYSDNFIDVVRSYQQIYQPRYTVIHSTVPVGTSRKLGATHSLIRGLHPNLESGIKTFPKILAGRDASQVADYFRRAGLKVILFDEPEAGEAAKLFDTEYYRACIEFAHRVKKYCDENKLNFTEVYTIMNETYNGSYTQLGYPEYVRPVLQPIMTKIGGHCVGNNKVLISMSEDKKV